MIKMKTPSVEKNLNAKDFSLLGIDEKTHSLKEGRGERGTVIIFMCNHCPFVKSIIEKIKRDSDELLEYKVETIAIMSNDVDEYPEDSFENMKIFARKNDLKFPYLIDKDQSVAKSYGAVCTPDFFGFDKDLKLQYRGRLDDSGMKEAENRERELFNAMKDISLGISVKTQRPSIGCSIKWR